MRPRIDSLDEKRNQLVTSQAGFVDTRFSLVPSTLMDFRRLLFEIVYRIIDITLGTANCTNCNDAGPSLVFLKRGQAVFIVVQNLLAFFNSRSVAS